MQTLHRNVGSTQGSNPGLSCSEAPVLTPTPECHLPCKQSANIRVFWRSVLSNPVPRSLKNLDKAKYCIVSWSRIQTLPHHFSTAVHPLKGPTNAHVLDGWMRGIITHQTSELHIHCSAPVLLSGRSTPNNPMLLQLL